MVSTCTHVIEVYMLPYNLGTHDSTYRITHKRAHTHTSFVCVSARSLFCFSLLLLSPTPPRSPLTFSFSRARAPSHKHTHTSPPSPHTHTHWQDAYVRKWARYSMIALALWSVLGAMWLAIWAGTLSTYIHTHTHSLSLSGQVPCL